MGRVIRVLRCRYMDCDDSDMREGERAHARFDEIL